MEDLFFALLGIAFYVAWWSFLIWIYGIIIKAASDEGAKKGYDPVWSAVNGGRFGLMAVIYYKYIAPKK